MPPLPRRGDRGQGANLAVNAIADGRAAAEAVIKTPRGDSAAEAEGVQPSSLGESGVRTPARPGADGASYGNWPSP
ncbi:MAG: hypothetical protein LBD37_02620 [Treponema sp.]|nr:hypothetical protein [Treponema sp.]